MILDIDPKVDYAFKHLFGRDSTRALLIDVINNVIAPAAGHEVQEIELLNPFNPKEAFDDKLSILDIKARDSAGRQFNVEMQMLSYRYYEKRILYYWSRLHQQQLREGQDYLELQPTISVSFLDHVLFPNVPDYHLKFRLTEESRQLAFSDDIELHILELPKFGKSSDELANGLDFWLYFLRHAAKMDVEKLPSTFKLPLVMRAFEELKMLSATDLEREQYESRRKWQLDWNTGMKVARMDGIEEGRQLGRNETLREAAVEKLHIFERILKLPETPEAALVALSLEELAKRTDELERQFFQQR